MTKQIISHYKKSGSYLATWQAFKFMKYSQREIRRILREAGVLQAPQKEEDFKVIPDYKNYFTDEDYPFEQEIKTRIYK